MHAVSCFFFFLAALGLSSAASLAAGQVADDAVHEIDAHAWRESDAERAGTERWSAIAAPAVFTGRVLLPDGEPAAGAVVVTSAGGQCVTAADGSFELEVRVPLKAQGVQVSAVGRAPAGAGSLVASVASLALSGTTRVETLVLALTNSCQPSWLPTFGAEPGVSGFSVIALTVFDDGSGEALYAGGDFTTAGGVVVNYIAKWNGTSWSALGSGMDDDVRALTVFDDGSGEALYAGGDFTTAGGVAADRIAKWNGTSWSALASGMDVIVNDLTVFDDGSGEAL